MKPYIHITSLLSIISVLLITQVGGFTQLPTKWYTPEQSLIPNALSGGFLAPQFSSFDLDRDGLQELISFDRFSGKFQVWRISNTNDGELTIDRSFKIEWPVVASWCLVRDFNQDNIPDLFTQGFHGIAVYEGYKEHGIIRFRKMSGEQFLDDSLLFQDKLGNTTNIYHAASDIPVIDDVDQDGDLDIMSFDLSGSYLYLYENQHSETSRNLRFILTHKCWGYFVENQISDEIKLSNTPYVCPPPFSIRHSGSASCLVDVNRDLIPDLLLGDRGAKSIKVLINNGVPAESDIKDVRPGFPNSVKRAILHYFPAAYKVNLNQDTLTDVLIAVNDYPLTDGEGIWAYTGTQDSLNPFQLQSDHWMSGRHIDLGQYSSPYMLNVNGDEWPDVLIAYQVTEDPGKPLNRIAYFHGINENEFQLESLDYGNLSEVLSEGFRPYLTAGDVDGDNDLDLLIGVSNGESYLIQNGSGKNDEFLVESIIKDWAGLSMLDGATPELYDIDRDGDLDVIAGNDAGTINVYRNKGDLSTAIFDSDLDQFPNLKNIGQINTSGQNSLLGRSSPRIIELDSDTVLVSGSHKGYLYTYKTNLQDPGSQFEKIIMDDWPQWTGGNNRLVFSQGNDGYIRIFSGNIAGGITEHVVVRVPTYSSVVSPTENRLFPNPVLSGQDIHIRLNPEATVEKVHIFGPGGSYYSSFDVESGSCKISTRNWSPGIYFIRINLQNKGSLVHKVVIQ